MVRNHLCISNARVPKSCTSCSRISTVFQPYPPPLNYGLTSSSADFSISESKELRRAFCITQHEPSKQPSIWAFVGWRRQAIYRNKPSFHKPSSNRPTSLSADFSISESRHPTRASRGIPHRPICFDNFHSPNELWQMEEPLEPEQHWPRLDHGSWIGGLLATSSMRTNQWRHRGTGGPATRPWRIPSARELIRSDR